MKKVFTAILLVTMILSLSTMTAYAMNEENYPYMGRSTATLAFRDSNGSFIKNLGKGEMFKVLYQDPRDSDRVWVEWDGMEGSIIVRCVEKIDQEVDLTNSSDAYLTGSLNLRKPDNYEWVALLERGTKVTVIGEDPYNSDRTIVRCGDLEGSVLSSYVMRISTADFILVDIDKQMVYLYKSGMMVVCSEVVTGMKDSRDTPRGFFSIQGQSETAKLSGEGYRDIPVKYWMPFYDGCGFHSASWRHAFGGNIYTYDGSHGCVNCPTEFAKTLYENSYVGMAVIIP